MVGMLVACSPTYVVSNYRYYLQDTTTPQELVDSLLGFHSDYKTWPTHQYVGMYRGDSTVITNRTYWSRVSDTLAISATVTEYRLTDTCTVKLKPIKIIVE